MFENIDQKILALVDRAIHTHPIVNQAVTFLAEKLLPQTTAKATYFCDWDPWDYCATLSPPRSRKRECRIQCQCCVYVGCCPAYS